MARDHRKSQQSTLFLSMGSPWVTTCILAYYKNHEIESRLSEDKAEVLLGRRWGKKELQWGRIADSPGQHMSGNSTTMCSLKVRGSPWSAKDMPLWCSKGSGQRGSRTGSRRPPGHGLVQRSREGMANRKAILAGSRMSVETVKQRVLQLSTEGCPVPNTPLHTYPQRTFPQIDRKGQCNSFCDG